MKISSVSEQVTTSKLLYIYLTLPVQSKFNTCIFTKRWLLVILQFYLLESYHYSHINFYSQKNDASIDINNILIWDLIQKLHMVVCNHIFAQNKFSSNSTQNYLIIRYISCNINERRGTFWNSTRNVSSIMRIIK